MAGMSTTTPGMQQAEGYLASTQSTATKGVSQVREMLDVLRSSWTGDASGAFAKSMDDWLTDCRFISQKLGEMVELMKGNRQAITSGESTNVERASAIPVGPGLQGL
ncbi:WXG100 family type VII secretion target [Lentzea sp.]|uniref:WXG100 family type VII secretion target n=1 Tax=Lentzea sp. TaxID=56099 RepID=UPI002ED1FC13